MNICQSSRITPREGEIDRVSQFPVAGTQHLGGECVQRNRSLNCPKVLAITKRTAQLCGTQPLLYEAGFALMTATSMDIARSIIKAVAVKGVIVCRGSWSEQESASIVAELAADHPEITVILRCPGCTGCGEASHTPGTLSDISSLAVLISADAPATKA
jgi:hypothetical protein